jgi:acetoin utilization protein AcuB
MLAGELNNNLIPQLQLQDTVAKALQLVTDYRVSHLPVVADDKFLGLVSEDDLLDAEGDKVPIEALQKDFIQACVKESEHFLQAVNISNQFLTDVVPVINEEREFMGTITSRILLKTLGTFSGAQELGGLIVLEMERSQFAISEISRIVESNDAVILHLNTTIQPITGLFTVTLHINKKELSAIIASFQRYEYDVLYSFGDDQFESDIDTNYRNLLHYLEI